MHQALRGLRGQHHQGDLHPGPPCCRPHRWLCREYPVAGGAGGKPMAPGGAAHRDRDGRHQLLRRPVLDHRDHHDRGFRGLCPQDHALEVDDDAADVLGGRPLRRRDRQVHGPSGEGKDGAWQLPAGAQPESRRADWRGRAARGRGAADGVPQRHPPLLSQLQLAPCRDDVSGRLQGALLRAGRQGPRLASATAGALLCGITSGPD
mmetsp:Transcript_86054/g.256749  ORF Transcript_86054/g.256749 Transcript_86054/m.256749 type:complete len:206 (-) Transcript_86054:87-704(-)